MNELRQNSNKAMSGIKKNVRGTMLLKIKKLN